MYRPLVPGAVTLARRFLVIESFAWLLLFLYAIWLSRQPVDWVAMGNFGGVSSGGRAAYFGLIAIPVALAFWGIWAGAALGRLTDGPRISAISLATLGVVFGLFSLLFPGRLSTEYAGVGIILIVWNAAIIYALTLDLEAREAFQETAASEYREGAETMYGASLQPWPSAGGGYAAGSPDQPWYRQPPEPPPSSVPTSPAFPVQPGFARRPGFAPPREARFGPLGAMSYPPPPDPQPGFPPPPRPRP